jgi:putative membrane protein
MWEMFVTWMVSSIVLYLTAVLVPGITIKSFGSAMWASIVVGLLNMLLRPILIFLTLPINFLTLGLFTFVVNAIVLRMAAGLLKGFDIEGWLPAILGAVVLALLQALVYMFFGSSQAVAI